MFSVKVWGFIVNGYVPIFTGTMDECIARRAAWFAAKEREYGHAVDMTRCIIE